MMCNKREWENKYYIGKVVSEECGAYMHFSHNPAFPQAAGTPFINFGLNKVYTVALQKSFVARAEEYSN